jgi:hypothetical protein
MREHAASIINVEVCRVKDRNGSYGVAARKAVTQTHERGEKIELGSEKAACCLAYSSTMKMDAVRSSKTSVNFCQTIWRHIQKTTF